MQNAEHRFSVSTGHAGLRRKGAKIEQAAAAFLIQHGVVIANRNFRSGRTGEIDLIGYDGPTLIFVEVKYRSGDRCGSPEEAVTAAKQRTICRTARYYLVRYGIPENQPIRFDVVAVRPAPESGDGRLAVTLHWIRGAFDYYG